MKARVCIIAILLSAFVWAQAEEQEGTVERLTISSPSFRNNQPIPAKNSLDGGDISPALKWEGATDGTKGFALICDDPDAPGGTWIHWVMYGIPAGTTELPEGIKPNDTVVVTGGVSPRMAEWKLGFGSDFRTVSQLPECASKA